MNLQIGGAGGVPIVGSRIRAYLRRLADEDRELDIVDLARHVQVIREAAAIRREKLLPALVGRTASE